MSPDQVHGQNYEVIKGTSGATHLLNRQDKSGLAWWQLCGHEITRILIEFKSVMSLHATEVPMKKHHEDTPTFQKRFSSDAKKVLGGIIHNPFELDHLTKINNTNVVFNDTVFKSLSNLIDVGENQFNAFWNERLTTAAIPVDASIKKNSFLIPGKFEDQQNEKQKKLVYSNSIMNKLRSAADVRKEKASQLFETELFGVAQSLAETNTTLYHGNKSDILKRFPSFSGHTISNSSAAVIDLSPIIKGMDVSHCDTFSEFASCLYAKMSNQFIGHRRIDLIIDRYFKDSLKENLREERGIGCRLLFDDTTKLPPNFHSDFLKNSENKDELGRYLGKKFIESHSNQNQILVVTYEHTIMTTNPEILEEISISDCKSEEADQRIIRHVLNLSKKGDYSDILACTYDTDVFMLLVAYFPFMERSSEINLVCQFGFGNNPHFYSINEIAQSIGTDKCKALPFFHAFSGCDTVSSFFNRGKTKFWDTWMSHGNKDLLTETFKVLSDQPKEISESQMDIIEAYVKAVYYPNSKNLGKLNFERLNHFCRQADPNLRVIPPSRNGLTEHTKRGALQGWIWAEARSNVEYQRPEKFGWQKKDDRFSPKWQTQTERMVDVIDVCKTCTCQKALCKKCKYSKDTLRCLPFCGCHRRCEDHS